VGREKRAITKVFKNTKIRVMYSTNNTLRKLFTKKKNTTPTGTNMKNLEYTKLLAPCVT
jgi:hypothetical protein